MKRLFFLVLILLGSALMQAQTFRARCSTGQELEYVVLSDNQSVWLVRMVGESDTNQLVIPEVVTDDKGKTYSVACIGFELFYPLNRMTTLYIPKSVVDIQMASYDLEIGDICVAQDNPAYQIVEEETESQYTRSLYDKSTGARLWHGSSASKLTWWSDRIVRFPQVKAEYPGGMPELKKFLAENTDWPFGVREFAGVVLVEFVIEKDGTISDIEIIRSLHPLADAEVIRVIKSMPKWIPAQNDGEPCRSFYTIPITFAKQ